MKKTDKTTRRAAPIAPRPSSCALSSLRIIEAWHVHLAPQKNAKLLIHDVQVYIDRDLFALRVTEGECPCVRFINGISPPGQHWASSKRCDSPR